LNCKHRRRFCARGHDVENISIFSLSSGIWINSISYRKLGSMKKTFKPIIIALVFATLLIASSYFLKDKPIGDWIDSGIYIIGVYCLFQYFGTSAKNCSRKVS